MPFSFIQQDRRRELRANPCPEDWLPYLQEVVLCRFLSTTDQAKLQDAKLVDARDDQE
jgi:hypothetical protein